jgi:hypothetical protein
MAGNAVIGALRVSLGLDSAQFETGLKNSQSKMEDFGKKAKVAFAAAAAAAAAATVALGYAVKGAMDAADAMGKAAASTGMTTEALSRLKHAADLSGVGFEQLQGGLSRLSATMANVAAGAGGMAKTAFDALGISVKNADGTLRSSAAVLGDVADRFARMENSSTKTAIAVNIFGRAGADLIPMLNAGSAGLAAMAEESDRLGLTISSRTAAASELFNDNLSRMSGMLQGVANRLANSVAPVLAEFTSRMLVAIEKSGILNTATQALTWVFQQFAKAVVLVSGSVATVSAGIGAAGAAISAFVSGDWNGAVAALQTGGTEISAVLAQMQMDFVAIDFGTFGDSVVVETAKASQGVKDYAVALEKAANATAKIKDTSLRDWSDIASGYSSVLSGIFKENKVAATAMAIVDGIAAVAKTFAQYGATPLGFAAMGLATLTAAANVAAINATTETSSSMPSVGGGNLSSADMAPATAAGPQKVMNVSLTGQGGLSRDQFREFIEAANKFGGDGMRLNFT